MITVEIANNLKRLIESQDQDLLAQANEMISVLTDLEIDPSLLHYFLVVQDHDLNTLTQEEVNYLSPKYKVWKDLKVVDSSLSSFSVKARGYTCLLYTSPSPRDKRQSRMPSSA